MVDRLLALLAVILISATASFAETDCSSDTFERIKFTACTVDPGKDRIKLFHSTPDGALIASFTALQALVEEDDDRLVVAMNGGMYHPDRRPVGLYVEDGVQQTRLITSAGPGNFGLLPNGVFCIEETKASIVESRRFAETKPDCDFATQSGPLMVEAGKLHPRFIPDSSSTFVRNGVGVREDGTVVLAISDVPVNFHRFARLFRDKLDTPDALYLDGRVSRLFVPDLGRAGIGLPLGPILGVIEPAD